MSLLIYPIAPRIIVPSGPTMPSGPAWVLNYFNPATQTTTGGGAPTTGQPSSSIADAVGGSGRIWTASSAQRATYDATIFSGRGGLIYSGSQRMVGATAAPPTGPVTYVHTWQLTSLPSGAAWVLMGEGNASTASILFLTGGLGAYRPIAFAAGYSSADPVGLNVTLTTGVTTLAWTYLATDPASPGTPANPASRLQYRAALNGVDVTSSILAGLGGGVGAGTANNCIGSYDTSGTSSFIGNMYAAARWDRGFSAAELIQASTWRAN